MLERSTRAYGFKPIVSRLLRNRKVNVAEKFNLFSDYWSPRIAAAIDDSYVKLVKVKDEFGGTLTKGKMSSFSS
jgi:hypothetical protein